MVARVLLSPRGTLWVVAIAVLAVIASSSVVVGDDHPANDRVAGRLAKLRRPLTTIRIDANSTLDAPPNLAAAMLETDQPTVITGDDGSAFLPDRYTTRFLHRPLYFQELNLERCGTSYGCAQNAVSAAYFIGNAAILPYRMALDRADQCVESWGELPTGRRYANDLEPLSVDLAGGVNEAAAIAGFVFLLL